MKYLIAINISDTNRNYISCKHKKKLKQSHVNLIFHIETSWKSKLNKLLEFRLMTMFLSFTLNPLPYQNGHIWILNIYMYMYIFCNVKNYLVTKHIYLCTQKCVIVNILYFLICSSCMLRQNFWVINIFIHVSVNKSAYFSWYNKDVYLKFY